MSSHKPFGIRQARVLMIAGGDFVDRMIRTQTAYLTAYGKFRFSVLGYPGCTSLRKEAETGAIARFHEFPEPRFPLQAGSSWWKLPFDLLPWPATPGPLAGEMQNLKRAVYRRLFWREATRRLPPLLADYDLFHWHCFLPELLPALQYFPSRRPLIVTLWGSDLYRTAGLEEYRRQLAAMERPTVFTVATPEMRETILAKFGRQWSAKIRIMNYGTENLGAITEARGLGEEFLRRYGIPTGRIIVCIGHNAIRENQHLAILESIGKLPDQLLRRLALILPMTYGQQAEYMEEVRRAASRLPTEVRIFDKFLNPPELAQLRVATDVFVHLPVSDQFSAALSEALFAGSVAITGSWLPYSRLRLGGVYYREVTGCQQVGPVLAGVVEQFEQEKARAAGNPDAVFELMDWGRVAPRWVELYEALLHRSEDRIQ